jgi:hypothetical protein
LRRDFFCAVVSGGRGQGGIRVKKVADAMIGFPLLLIPLAIYNIFVFLMPGVSLTAPVVTLHLLSGASWAVSFGDILVALGIVLMLFEFSRASRPGAKYVMDHLLSILIVGGAAAEFLWLTAFGTSTFALLVILAAVDLLSGITQALRHRRARRAALREAAFEAPAAAEVPQPVEPKLAETKPPAEHVRPKVEVITPEIDSPPKPSSAPAVVVPPKSDDHIPDPDPESIGWRTSAAANKDNS